MADLIEILTCLGLLLAILGLVLLGNRLWGESRQCPNCGRPALRRLTGGDVGLSPGKLADVFCRGKWTCNHCERVFYFGRG